MSFVGVIVVAMLITAGLTVAAVVILGGLAASVTGANK